MLPGPVVTMVGGGDLLMVVFHKVKGGSCLCVNGLCVNLVRKSLLCSAASHVHACCFTCALEFSPQGFRSIADSYPCQTFHPDQTPPFSLV